MGRRGDLKHRNSPHTLLCPFAIPNAIVLDGLGRIGYEWSIRLRIFYTEMVSQTKVAVGASHAQARP
jgi:hypothetical protein